MSTLPNGHTDSVGLRCAALGRRQAVLPKVNLSPTYWDSFKDVVLVVCPESPLGLSEQSECGKLVCPTSLEALGCLPPKLENL
jgi:hypothetical protein